MKLSDRPIAILDGVRTPFAKAFGALRDATADDLGTACLRELLQRSGLPGSDIDQVILGCVGQPSDAMNIARVVALRAGLPASTIAHTVHRNCASGLEAIAAGVEKILTGQAETVIVGGTESMSNYPLELGRRGKRWFEAFGRAATGWARAGQLARWRPSMMRPRAALERGLRDKTCGLMMGDTAELLADEFGITRGEQDAFALASHKRAAEAWDSGRLAPETIPVFASARFEPVAADIGYRPNQTIEALAKLRPIFEPLGSVTAGNSSMITDGAAMLLLMPADKAKAAGYDILGVIDGYRFVGLEPSRMGLGPVHATSALVAELGVELEDFDRIEINEAFAAQVLACREAAGSASYARANLNRDKALGALAPHKTNVNGGALALGHPVGATGARLVLTLLLELQRANLERGLATLCVGGGQGAALAVRRPAA